MQWVCVFDYRRRLELRIAHTYQTLTHKANGTCIPINKYEITQRTRATTERSLSAREERQQNMKWSKKQKQKNRGRTPFLEIGIAKVVNWREQMRSHRPKNTHTLTTVIFEIYCEKRMRKVSFCAIGSYKETLLSGFCLDCIAMPRIT